MKRILVCGARDYTNVQLIHETLRHHLVNDGWFILINGCAKGADSIARLWGLKYLGEKRVKDFPAQWKIYGRGAGLIRNQQMLDEGKPDLVLAFGGKDGTGTNDMVRRSKKAGIPVLEYDR